MNDNPFASPGDAENTEPTLRTHRKHARLCLLFVAFVCGAMAVNSIVAFFVNLTFKYPGTDKSVIAVAPLWMVGHVIHGVGFGVLTWCVVRYQSAIKRWVTPDSASNEEFLTAHASFWKTVALVFFVFFVFFTTYMVVEQF